MNTMARLTSALSGLLVGLGVAVFARAVVEVGFSQLVLGHVVGPGLVAAGLARIRLQRMLDDRSPPGDRPPSGEGPPKGGDDG